MIFITVVVDDKPLRLNSNRECSVKNVGQGIDLYLLFERSGLVLRPTVSSIKRLVIATRLVDPVPIRDVVDDRLVYNKVMRTVDDDRAVSCIFSPVNFERTRVREL